MASHNFNALNESELERNLEKVKEVKHTCTFKLNLLRDAATFSAAHLNTFNSLENRLCNAQEQVFDLEAKEKERMKAKSNGLGLDHGDDGDEIRYGLKKSIVLIGIFDGLAEDIARLKFVLEEPKQDAEGARGAAAPASSSQNPINPSSAPKDPKIKQEELVPTHTKERNWAPAGYHYVKAHFRKNPRRKSKAAVQEDSEEDGPGSFDIVQVE